MCSCGLGLTLRGEQYHWLIWTTHSSVFCGRTVGQCWARLYLIPVAHSRTEGISLWFSTDAGLSISCLHISRVKTGPKWMASVMNEFWKLKNRCLTFCVFCPHLKHLPMTVWKPLGDKDNSNGRQQQSSGGRRCPSEFWSIGWSSSLGGDSHMADLCGSLLWTQTTHSSAPNAVTNTCTYHQVVILTSTKEDMFSLFTESKIAQRWKDVI